MSYLPYSEWFSSIYEPITNIDGKTKAAKSCEYVVMRNIIKNNVASANSIFSIAPRNGLSDILLLDHFKSQFYNACEENTYHSMQIKRLLLYTKNNPILNKVPRKIFQDNLFKDEGGCYSTSADKTKHDLIIMSHCLYDVENPLNIIRGLINDLTPNGKLVIFIAAKLPDVARSLIDLIDECKERLELPKNKNYVEDLYKELKSNDVFNDLQMKLIIESSQINISSVDTDDKRCDFLSYFLGIDVKGINDDIKMELAHNLEVLSLPTYPLVEHATGCIVIEGRK